jgi:hypothetical protein
MSSLGGVSAPLKVGIPLTTTGTETSCSNIRRRHMRNIIALYASTILAPVGKSGGGRVLPDLSQSAKAAATKAAAKADAIAKAAAEVEEKAKAEAAKAAKKAAGKAAERQVDYRTAKAEKRAEVQEEFGHMLLHKGTITKGKNKGRTGEVIWVGVNRWLQPMVRLNSDGETLWENPTNVEKGTALPKARQEVLKAEEQERSSATLFVPGTCTSVTEKGVVIAYAGWFRRLTFAKADVTKVGSMGELDVFELPEWKVRQDAGQDSVDALRTKQETIVNTMTAVPASAE